MRLGTRRNYHPAADTYVDMINMIKLEFLPSSVCWVSPKNSHVSLLACSEKENSNIHFFDGKGGSQQPLFTISTVHSDPVHIIKYNPVVDVMVSVDQKGKIEYWRPESDLPKFTDLSGALWSYKSETDLYIFQKVSYASGGSLQDLIFF